MQIVFHAFLSFSRLCVRYAGVGAPVCVDRTLRDMQSVNLPSLPIILPSPYPSDPFSPRPPSSFPDNFLIYKTTMLEHTLSEDTHFADTFLCLHNHQRWLSCMKNEVLKFIFICSPTNWFLCTTMPGFFFALEINSCVLYSQNQM